MKTPTSSFPWEEQNNDYDTSGYPSWDEDYGYVENQNALQANPTMMDLTSFGSSEGTLMPQYKKGGKVKKKKSMPSEVMEEEIMPMANEQISAAPNIFPLLAELVRSQGEGEDIVLAHINQKEAAALSLLSPTGGTINPVTGLPQFGLGNFLKNPFRSTAKTLGFKPGNGGLFGKNIGKAIGSSLGGAGGAVLGNMFLPGVGGIIGGALGQGVQHSARGKNFLDGALKGAATGALLPSAASLAGAGLNGLGATNAGAYLTNYGNTNAILPALGFGGESSSMASGGMGAAGSMAGGASNYVTLPSSGYNASLGAGFNPAASLGGGAASGAGGAASGAGAAGNTSFMGSLFGNTKNFLSQPQNLLATGIAASSLLNRPKPKKEKSPEELAREHKRYALASMMTPEELAAWESGELEKTRARRRIERNKFLPEERLGEIEPLYVQTATPEEYKKSGKWLSYYDNPEFKGKKKVFAKGGSVKDREFFEEIEYPTGLSFFMEGNSGGQDDDRRMDLDNGSYIIDASTTAHLGDGNNRKGAEKISALVSDGETYISPEGVKRIGKGDHKKGTNMLDRLVKNVRLHKGGSAKLPPKALSMSRYMKGGK